MIDNRSLTIAIVAGEKSGDILGASLIRTLRARVPNAHFVGIAGPLMQAEGCEVWYKMEELSVMGIIEIIQHLYRLLKIRIDIIHRLSKLQPDCFIGIDSPDFNINLEGKLKKLGIKTIHYVSPSIWAWRKKRIFKIGRSTDLVLTILPFEKKIYDMFNIPCRFIGHVMADIIPFYPDKNAVRDALGISHNARCLALLPGSRNTEIKMLSAIFLEAAKILCYFYPDLNIIVPLVNTECREQFNRIATKIVPELHIHMLDGKGKEAMMASDVALIASGTAALECMLAKCPMVIGYRMNSFTFWLVKRLVNINYISLPNLLADCEIVREFLQEECQPKILAAELLHLLVNDKNNKKMRDIFLNLHQKIRCNASEQAADAILELMR